jgi:hypothetical protein
MYIRAISLSKTMRRISAVCKKTRKLEEWISEAQYEKVLHCSKAWRSVEYVAAA